MSRKLKRLRTLRVPVVELLKDTPWFEVEGHEKLRPGKLPKFTGALRTPIVQSLSNQPVISGKANIDGAIDGIWEQRIEKLILLMKHYHVEDTNDPWLLLGVRLGCAFVPGLRVLSKPPPGRGRPKGAKKWTGEARDELIAAVKAVQAERKGRSIANSIKILKKRDPSWLPLDETRYYEAVRDRKLRDQAIRALAAPTASAENGETTTRRFFAAEKSA